MDTVFYSLYKHLHILILHEDKEEVKTHKIYIDPHYLIMIYLNWL